MILPLYTLLLLTDTNYKRATFHGRGSALKLSNKRKGHPAKGGLFFQGRIVPTEIKPSKLSGEIL
jgi:hypothetical protein